MTDEKKEIRRPVTESENEVAYSGPAPGSNRFFINVGTPGVRIAFGEEIPGTGKVFFRSAVTLHPSDAIALHKVLKDLLDPIEKQIIDVKIDQAK